MGLALDVGILSDLQETDPEGAAEFESLFADLD